MRRFVVVLSLLLACVTPAFAQDVAVIKNVNLRSTPSTEHAAIRLLKRGEQLTLVSPTLSSGYYEVRTSRNEPGWVWARNVSLVSTPVVNALSASGATGGSSLPLGKADTIEPGKYAMHSSCPPSGDETTPNSDGSLRNLAKRWMAADKTPVSLTVAEFATLQKNTDSDAVKHSHQRDQLTLVNIEAGSKKVSEGDRVSLSGYLNRVDNGAIVENVNCKVSKKSTKDGRDVHINIGPEPNGNEFAGVVVELIPQLPVSDWSIDVARTNAMAALKRVKKAKLRVLAVGSLTYDNEHRVNAVKTHSIGGQPARVSLWEIHPVLDFYVCPTGVCDPTTPDKKWQRLTDWATAHPK